MMKDLKGCTQVLQIHTYQCTSPKKKKKLINAHIYTGKTEVSFKNTKTTSIFIGCPHLMCQETQLDFLSLPLLMWKATL